MVIHPCIHGKHCQEWKVPASERLKLQPSGFSPLGLGFSLCWGARVSSLPARIVPIHGYHCDLVPPDLQIFGVPWSQGWTGRFSFEPGSVLPFHLEPEKI